MLLLAQLALQTIALVWAFRMSTHPPRRSANTHFRAFAILAAVSLVFTLIIGYANDRTQNKLRAEIETVAHQQKEERAEQLATGKLLTKMVGTLQRAAGLSVDSWDIGSERDTDAQRPILAVTQVGRSGSQDKGPFSVVVQNVGGESAFNAHGFVMLSAVDPRSSEPYPSYSEDEAKIPMAEIRPHTKVMLSLDSTLSDSYLDGLLRKGNSLYLLGSVWFSDKDGQKLQTAFCYQLDQSHSWVARTPRTGQS